jgi:hypothetical protein
MLPETLYSGFETLSTVTILCHRLLSLSLILVSLIEESTAWTDLGYVIMLY